MSERTLIEGWIFDVQEEEKGVGIWLVDGRGASLKLLCPFKPYFYIAGSYPQKVWK